MRKFILVAAFLFCAYIEKPEDYSWPVMEIESIKTPYCLHKNMQTEIKLFFKFLAGHMNLKVKEFRF
jgi:hypothetical protein